MIKFFQPILESQQGVKNHCLSVSEALSCKYQHRLDFIATELKHKIITLFGTQREACFFCDPLSVHYLKKTVPFTSLTSATASACRGSDFKTCGLGCPQFGWCLGTLLLSFLSSLPLTLSFSLPSSLPQKSWKKWAPCWPRQAVRFCKLTALIMSFCYSDTRSARPPHWPRSRPGGEAGPAVGLGPRLRSPPPTAGTQ